MRKPTLRALHLCLIGIVLLSLLLAGCGGGGNAGQTKATEKPAGAEPTATIEPTQETSSGGGEKTGGEEDILKNLLKIGPIHMTSAYSVKEGDKVTDEGSMEGDIDAKGNQHATMTSNGKKLEAYVIGDTIYLLSEGEEQFLPMQGAAKDTPFMYLIGYGGFYALGVGIDSANKAGAETVNGLNCDKYAIDSTSLGVAWGALAGMDYKGFAWVEPKAKALIRSQFDWTIKATNDSAAQAYHSEFNASKGTVTEIKPPENVFDINAMLTPQATEAPAPEPTEEAAPTEESQPVEQPTATAVPKSEAAVGDTVEVQGLAYTVNKVELTAGPADFTADEGYTWLLVYVTVENVSNQDRYTDPEIFDLVDESGIVYNNLEYPSTAWPDISKSILETKLVAAGGKLKDRILLIEMEQAVIPGLKLRMTDEVAGRTTLWDLGL